MNPLVAHLASGDGFWTGGILVIVAMSFPHRPTSAAVTRCAGLLALIGVMFILGSAAPAFPGFSAVLAIGLVAFLAIVRREGVRMSKALVGIRTAMVVAVFGAGIIEAQWAFPGTLNEYTDKHFPGSRFPRLIVVGDSVSGGLGEKVPPWPELKGITSIFEVTNLAHAGDGVELALQRIEGKLKPHAIVVVEIGGNDMLGSTSADDFERALDQLLSNLHGDGRCVVMLELPLLPNKVAFGRIQRRLASKHDVFVIPKRFFANVITAEGATEDGLHLSEQGTWSMAYMVMRWIAPEFAHPLLHRNMEIETGNPPAPKGPPRPTSGTPPLSTVPPAHG